MCAGSMPFSLTPWHRHIATFSGRLRRRGLGWSVVCLVLSSFLFLFSCLPSPFLLSFGGVHHPPFGFVFSSLS